jgi:hypothetical protein
MLSLDVIGYYAFGFLYSHYGLPCPL